MRLRSGLSLLLWELQSPINIGMILRVAETYESKVLVYGSREIFATDTKKETVGNFACGALERAGYQQISTLDQCLDDPTQSRRLIATTIEAEGTNINFFNFCQGDIVILGNEYEGLPVEVLSRCAEKIRIPMADVWTPKPLSTDPIDPIKAASINRNGMPSLNVAIAAAIVCYAHFISRR